MGRAAFQCKFKVIIYICMQHRENNGSAKCDRVNPQTLMIDPIKAIQHADDTDLTDNTGSSQKQTL